MVKKIKIKIKSRTNNELYYRVPASQHPEIAPAEFEKYVDALGYLVKRKGDKRRQSILSEYFTANDSSSQESQIKLRRSVSLPSGNDQPNNMFINMNRNTYYT